MSPLLVYETKGFSPATLGVIAQANEILDDYAGYVREYGYESWELDALEPSVIADLIRGTVLGLRDEDAWSTAMAREEEQRKALSATSKHWPDVVAFLNGRAS